LSFTPLGQPLKAFPIIGLPETVPFRRSSGAEALSRFARQSHDL
jgi:hypothetical protein